MRKILSILLISLILIGCESNDNRVVVDKLTNKESTNRLNNEIRNKDKLYINFMFFFIYNLYIFFI